MSLMIAIPSYDGKIHYDTARGLVQTAYTCAANRIGFACDIRPHDAFIGKARNILCEQFLERGFHDLLFVDADVGFDAAAVAEICRAPVDIAMGLYRMKVEGPEETKLVKYCALLEDPLVRHAEDPFLLKLKYGPAGFLRIRRPALEAMIAMWPDEWYTDGDIAKIHDFFPAGRWGNNFSGEDIAFCNRAYECGLDIWGVQGLSLRHYGEKRYPCEWRIDVPAQEVQQRIEEAA